MQGDQERKLLEEAFFNFDNEHSGFIPVDEMRGLLRDGQPMSEAEVHHIPLHTYPHSLTFSPPSHHLNSLSNLPSHPHSINALIKAPNLTSHICSH